MDKFKTIHYENFEEGDITNNYEENSQPLIPNKKCEHGSRELYERKAWLPARARWGGKGARVSSGAMER